MSVSAVGGTLQPPGTWAPPREDPSLVPCSRCGARYPAGYVWHSPHCPKRPMRQTVRNLARMYWRLSQGRGCAKYIRQQELARLRKHLNL